MEVKLDKQYPLQASVDQAWAILSDVRATAACMPGAQITEQLDDTHYKGIVKSKIGPAMMSFNGDIEVLGLDASARQLQMLGKGADKAGSSASMNLTARIEPGVPIIPKWIFLSSGQLLLHNSGRHFNNAYQSISACVGWCPLPFPALMITLPPPNAV